VVKYHIRRDDTGEYWTRHQGWTLDLKKASIYSSEAIDLLPEILGESRWYLSVANDSIQDVKSVTLNHFYFFTNKNNHRLLVQVVGISVVFGRTFYTCLNIVSGGVKVLSSLQSWEMATAPQMILKAIQLSESGSFIQSARVLATLKALKEYSKQDYLTAYGKLGWVVGSLYRL